MRANEFLVEETDPNAPPPQPGNPEFEKSKNSFVEIITKFSKDYTKELSDMKLMAPVEYKQKIQNRQFMIADFAEKLSQAFIAKGNNFITSRDFNDIGLNKIKFSSGTKTQKQNQATSTTPQTTTTTAQSAQPTASSPSLLGLKPSDPNYASLAAALERQSKKKTAGESIEEAVLNLTKNEVTLTPNEVNSLATRATQVWYKNRQLSTQNPTLYKKLTGQTSNNTSVSISPSYGSSGLTQQNQALGDPAIFGVNPQLQNKDFTQALVNKLDSISNKSDIEKLLQKIKIKAGIVPSSNNTTTT